MRYAARKSAQGSEVAKRKIIPHKNMASPIKETPVLFGEEALRFMAKIDNPRPVSTEEVKTARQSYELIMAIAKFKF